MEKKQKKALDLSFDEKKFQKLDLIKTSWILLIIFLVNLS